MRVQIVPKGCRDIGELRAVTVTEPRPRAGQVLIRIRAVSLNYRDQAVITGNYAGGSVSRDLIPLSDGAGEVIEVGEDVTRFKPGDRVMGLFSQVPPAGPPSAARAPLGSPLDGMLAEQVALYEDGVIAIPEGLSFEEAAALPCAACTAWNALFGIGRPVRPGDTVLVLGTGGVSMFALQFARAAGARVVATTSSDEKVDRVKALGASDVIDYRRSPEWDQEVLRVTGGRGADCVVEVGGQGTLGRSFKALASGGKVMLIGVLTRGQGDPNPHVLMMKNGTLHGVLVGGREIFEQMNRAISVNGIKPVIDRVVPFDEAREAYRHQASGRFIGKVVIRL